MKKPSVTITWARGHLFLILEDLCDQLLVQMVLGSLSRRRIPMDIQYSGPHDLLACIIR